VTITTTSSAVSLPPRIRNAQPDVRRLGSLFRLDDDLVVPASVEAQLELRPAPRGYDQVSKECVGDSTDRADGHATVAQVSTAEPRMTPRLTWKP
jgi:hypothetical protein